MKIAIVGSGIAGMVAARELVRDHDLTIFEAAGWVGGHSHTVDVEMDDGVHALDTGFLVYNEPGYPILTKLFEEAGVTTQDSDMSFSVSCERTGLEYNGTSLNALFAQRRNLWSPRFYGMVLDIARFYRDARKELLTSDEEPGPSLGEFLEERGYGKMFVEQHLLPMACAIWSGDRRSLSGFPAKYLARFFDNHGFLQLTGRRGWRSVVGGSREYVRRVTEPVKDRIRLATPVRAITRLATRVDVMTDAGTETFDHVVLATHSDQALALLRDASPFERESLGAIPYQANDVILHHDERLLPRARRAWASWNYHLGAVGTEASSDGAVITYYLNLLQRLRTKHHLCVTLNREEKIRPERILGRWTYHHPIYSAAAFAAQRRLAEIDGRTRTSFCGAWRGWGFHEDGARSGVECVARAKEIWTSEQRSLHRSRATPAA